MLFGESSSTLALVSERRKKEFLEEMPHSIPCGERDLHMSQTTTPGWREVYADALEDFDPARIEEAQKAVQRRAKEIWRSGSPETKERRELAVAIYFLNLFSLAEGADEKACVAIEISNGNYDA
jgi:hypothetical protein